MGKSDLERVSNTIKMFDSGTHLLRIELHIFLQKRNISRRLCYYLDKYSKVLFTDKDIAFPRCKTVSQSK